MAAGAGELMGRPQAEWHRQANATARRWLQARGLGAACADCGRVRPRLHAHGRCGRCVIWRRRHAGAPPPAAVRAGRRGVGRCAGCATEFLLTWRGLCGACDRRLRDHARKAAAEEQDGV